MLKKLISAVLCVCAAFALASCAAKADYSKIMEHTTLDIITIFENREQFSNYMESEVEYIISMNESAGKELEWTWHFYIVVDDGAGEEISREKLEKVKCTSMRYSYKDGSCVTAAPNDGNVSLANLDFIDVCLDAKTATRNIAVIEALSAEDCVEKIRFFSPYYTVNDLF